jgi:hypothetical protein
LARVFIGGVDEAEGASSHSKRPEWFHYEAWSRHTSGPIGDNKQKAHGGERCKGKGILWTLAGGDFAVTYSVQRLLWLSMVLRR